MDIRENPTKNQRIRGEVMRNFIDLTEFDKDEEISWSDAAICPYCGFIHQQYSDAFYNDGNWELICDYCNKKFRMETYISYTYTTSKISEVEDADKT